MNKETYYLLAINIQEFFAEKDSLAPQQINPIAVAAFLKLHCFY